MKIIDIHVDNKHKVENPTIQKSLLVSSKYSIRLYGHYIDHSNWWRVEITPLEYGILKVESFGCGVYDGLSFAAKKVELEYKPGSISSFPPLKRSFNELEMNRDDYPDCFDGKSRPRNLYIQEIK